jgi:uncharacterized integral membrane protein
MPLESLLVSMLGWAIFPLWLIAGAADWLCHRRSRIEETSGTRESWLHVVAFLEIALPTAAALFLQTNALLTVVVGAAVLAHMATSLLDTSVSQPRRHISPLEQQIHSYLEMLPMFAFAILFVLVLHNGEWREPVWRFAVRESPLPVAAVAATLLGLLAAFVMIAEELWRCARRESVETSGSKRPS